MERLTPVGYVLGEGRRAADVLAVQADLLRSEGIDPTWPGFDEKALLSQGDTAPSASA